MEEGRNTVGNDVRSHTVAGAVPSALVSLTTGFEMVPGRPSPLQSPTALLPLLHTAVPLAARTVLTHSFRRCCLLLASGRFFVPQSPRFPAVPGKTLDR